MNRRPLSNPLGDCSVVEAPQGSAPTKKVSVPVDRQRHRALQRFANDEIMLLIKRVRLK
jgi:hypothetical protein